MRQYTSRRMAITQALTDLMKNIKKVNGHRTDVANAEDRIRFWDEINEFPWIGVSPGQETRVYQGGGYKDRFLTVTIRCYVNQEDAQLGLEALFEDVETVVETYSRMPYVDSNGATQYTQQMSIISIDSDEGALEPLGVGEIQIEVRY